jgi:hypothetical protein
MVSFAPIRFVQIFYHIILCLKCKQHIAQCAATKEYYQYWVKLRAMRKNLSFRITQLFLFPFTSNCGGRVVKLPVHIGFAKDSINFLKCSIFPKKRLQKSLPKFCIIYNSILWYWISLANLVFAPLLVFKNSFWNNDGPYFSFRISRRL